MAAIYEKISQQRSELTRQEAEKLARRADFVIPQRTRTVVSQEFAPWEVKLVSAASSSALLIVEAIRLHSPNVAQAEASDLTQADFRIGRRDGGWTPGRSISLKWGKLGMGEEEAKMVGELPKELPEGATLTDFPESVVLFNFDYLTVDIDPILTRIGNGSISTSDFVADPESSIRVFAMALEHPQHANNVLFRGNNYCREPKEKVEDKK